MKPDFADMNDVFIEETQELLDMMEESLLDIQDNDINSENMSALFRSAHTIKGAAGMFELAYLEKFTHTAENLFDEIRNNRIKLTEDILNLFFKVKDQIQILVDFAAEDTVGNEPNDETQQITKQLLTQLENYLNNTQDTQSLSEEDFAVECEQLINENTKKREESEKKNTEEIPAKVIPNNKVETKKPKISTTLRVDASKIDSIINLVGEMVIANANVIEQSLRINDKKLIESVSILSRMLEEIREASMQTRLVPIGDTFSRFKRIVRDLSKELHKDIDLEIIGADTELDKTVTEKISDPLLHLVRNSIDHGIELPEDRLAKGKKEKGKITLKAFHEAGSIAIEIIDNGKGLDPEFLFNKAVEKGLVNENDILTDKQKINLIMTAGFSTAQAITNVSGRGVGMDVVKRNIEELRGSIELDSQINVGTTTTIRLPLTLAIIDGFMIKLGKQFYIIPLEMIDECIELSNQHKVEILENNYINLRGNILPLLDLRDFFDTEKLEIKRENIIIVNFAGNKIGLLVDELHGEFQTVIKPIGKIFRNVKGVGGATILGNGQVALILDIPMLMQYINKISLNYNKS